MDMKQAWKSNPGPEGAGGNLLLALKGFCMGAADIVPGVSGGTVAFITGIYDELVAAIKSFGVNTMTRLARLDLPGAVATMHLRFLLPLMFGLCLAVFSMARLMNHLLSNYPVFIWSLFFGLIAASIIAVGRRMGGITPARLLMAVAGTVVGYVIVGLVPVTTPESLWFIFLCGSLAICAMILPGISGAFILLLLGKYEYVTGTLKAPLADGNLVVILVFICGALVGITSFSRLLHFMLKRWHGLTVAALTGFMAGAMRKVWPWKEVLESKTIGHKTVVLREANILPSDMGKDFLVAVGMMALGFVMVLFLDWISRRGDRN